MPKKNYTPGELFNTAPVTAEKARKLRQKLTPAEKTLWERLRNRKFKRLKFRRQHPIDRYIVDFICIEKKLVIGFFTLPYNLTLSRLAGPFPLQSGEGGGTLRTAFD